MSCLNCGRTEEHSGICYPFDNQEPDIDNEYESDEFDDYIYDDSGFDDYDYDNSYTSTFDPYVTPF